MIKVKFILHSPFRLENLITQSTFALGAMINWKL